MAITSRPQDKYAFLFSGPTIPQFMKDLENVYDVLTRYYNYPAANIRVVLGSAPAALPSFAFTTVASVAALQFEIDGFVTAATGPAPGMPGYSKSALLYFTGGGDNSSGTSRLLTDGSLVATPGNTIDPTWLSARLAPLAGCQANVVMQQSYAGGFAAIFGGLAIADWSFTSACGASDEAPGDAIEGCYFTADWCKGLRYETLPAGTPDAGLYGDELGAAAEATDHGLSLAEAMEFSKQIYEADGYSLVYGTPAFTNSGGAQYLGWPEFLVRDGVPWYESEDIWLTHPNHPGVAPNDLWIADLPGAVAPYNNTMTVRVRNTGTHPVRRYSLGMQLYETPSLPIDQNTIPDRVPSSGLLMPIDFADIGTPTDSYDVAEWNRAFWFGTPHHCVKAEAKLLSADVDFSWDITARGFEAQRNLDPMAMAPAMADPAPLFEIQGFKQHEYGIQNPFDQPRRFAVLFPPDYQKLTAGYDLRWLENRGGELIPIELETEPRPHILLALEPRASYRLVLRAQAKRAMRQEREVRLPFTIAVEGEWPANRRAVDFRAALVAGDTARNLEFAAIAGFTVVLRQAAATLRGTVVDRAGKPAARATVIVETVDRLQRVAVKTDDRGRYELANINPDVYVVRTESDLLRSQDQVFFLDENRVATNDLRLTEDLVPQGRHVKVVLDRIRIRDDHEPWFKGKADLSFTTEVVPDLDENQKQVKRLPEYGVVRASDQPGTNEIQFGATVFDGVVKKNMLKIRIDGVEHDLFDPNDHLNTYERSFTGNPETWAGTYKPADERFDPEDVGDWAVWYRIVNV